MIDLDALITKMNLTVQYSFQSSDWSGHGHNIAQASFWDYEVQSAIIYVYRVVIKENSMQLIKRMLNTYIGYFTCCIARKFGGELNLAVWRSILQLPN